MFSFVALLDSTNCDVICLFVFSVREWIQCMQVCCHSRTTHSVSPPVHSSPHGHTHPPPATPMATSYHRHQHHSQVHLSSASTHSAAAAAPASAVIAGPTGLTGLGSLPANPTTFSYHLAPSTLAYLPLTSDLATQAHPSSAVAIDTGYVSGEPSPTEHAQMVRNLNIHMYSAW